MFHRKCISNRNQKNPNINVNPVYLGLSILDLQKTVMHEFWNDYEKNEEKRIKSKCKILFC